MATVKDEKSNAAAGRPATLAGDFADLVRTLKSLFHPYRPELHYMRGPGPAWRAKYAPAHTAEMPSAAGLVPLKAR